MAIRFKGRRRLLGLAAAVLVLLGGATACQPGALAITADPSLYPTFQPAVVDYVNRCDPASPTDVSVSAPAGTTVSVDGQAFRGGSYTAQVSQDVGDRFTLRVRTDSATRTHHVRCLPLDFPPWQAERTGVTQSQYYATVLPVSFAPAGGYGILFDTNGVPVWWTETRKRTTLFSLLPNNHFGIELIDGPAQELALDGSVVRTVNTVGGPSDFHDFILLPNGNYLLATAQEQPADLSVWGPPYEADTPVINHVFQEITPAGAVVWSWDTSAYIPVTETTSTWRAEPEPVTGLADPWHYNSVEWTGDGIIISFRHLDAVYKVLKSSGNIAWKLGGTARPESLTVVDDPVFDAGGSFSGQHDARLLPDGTVTVFDNGTRKGRAPRAVRYRLDLGLDTATLLEEITDRIASTSPCCGSTRRLPGGNWVSGWGGTAHITEQKPDGSRVFRINGGGSVIYRGTPVAFGRLSPSALRAGMEEQYAD